MILTALRKWKSKILISLLVVAILSGGYLVWQNRSLLEQRATLRAQRQTIIEANEQNQATIAELQSEIIRREKAHRERAAEQAKIVTEYQRAVKKRDAQIQQMRRDYEEIDAFLSIPVPDAFVEQWMRAKDRNENGDGVSATADGTDGSE